MASDSKPASERRLSDLLQKQQEPFMLDIYLLDNGYSSDKWSFDKAEVRCFSSHNIGKTLSLRKRKGSDSARVSRILKYVSDKFVLLGKIHKTKSSERREHEDVKGELAADKYCNGTSSSEASTIFEPFSSGDAGGDEFFSTICSSASSSLESLDALNLCNATEQSKQHSPVSVLETPPSENSASHNYSDFQNQSNMSLKALNIAAKESVFFWSMWDTLVETIEETHGSSSQYVKSNLMLHQTRKLLFDYVKEAVDSQTTKEMITSYYSSQPCILPQYPPPEQLALSTFEQIWLSSKSAGEIKNTTTLLQADLSGESHEWTHFRPETRRVVREVEGEISAEIIDEIISDLL